MKKTSAIFLVLLFIFYGCTAESSYCDIYEFSERINGLSENEILNTDDLVYSDDKSTAYWFPVSENEICVSFYLCEDTGKIQKCNVVFKGKKTDKELTDKIKTAYSQSNKYITENKYETENYMMISFEDSRYEENKTEPTLKKHIREEDLY